MKKPFGTNMDVYNDNSNSQFYANHFHFLKTETEAFSSRFEICFKSKANL